MANIGSAPNMIKYDFKQMQPWQATKCKHKYRYQHLVKLILIANLYRLYADAKHQNQEVDHATTASWVNISWLVISIVESWLNFIVNLLTAFHLLEYHRMHSFNRYYTKSGVAKHIPHNIASLNSCFIEAR